MKRFLPRSQTFPRRPVSTHYGYSVLVYAKHSFRMEAGSLYISTISTPSGSMYSFLVNTTVSVGRCNIRVRELVHGHSIIELNIFSYRQSELQELSIAVGGVAFFGRCPGAGVHRSAPARSFHLDSASNHIHMYIHRNIPNPTIMDGWLPIGFAKSPIERLCFQSSKRLFLFRRYVDHFLSF